MAAHGETPLSGSMQGDENLKLLIRFTTDSDKSNRDWSVMALGMYGPITDDVLRALLWAAEDDDCDVRAEAIEAIAERDRQLALPLVLRDLSRSPCGYGVFVAARRIADPVLIEPLKHYDYASEASGIDNAVSEALEACRRHCDRSSG